MQRKSPTGAILTQKMKLALLPLFLLCAVAGGAQAPQQQAPSDDDVLAQMQKRLATGEKLTYHKPMVFVGEISNLGPVFHGVCKEAVSQAVDFTISSLLWGDHPDSVVHTGYINCTWQPLPSPPFTLHAKVIVYCEQIHTVQCLNPVAFTDERVSRVESWIRAIDGNGEAAMAALHLRLLDSERLAKHQGFVMVGYIKRVAAIPRRRCASGVENIVSYRVWLVMWDFANSLLRRDYDVSRGSIDCRQAALPPAFVPEAKVIAYCEAEPGAGYHCAAPILFTDARYAKVQDWIEGLRRREGDPVLLQIHNHLRGSLELAPSRPLVLFGQVNWIAPPTFIHSVTVERYMRVIVSRLLWGYYKESEALTSCPSRDCSNVAVGAQVIAYCDSPTIYDGPPARCSLVSADFAEENQRRVEEWVEQARKGQETIILEKIQKYSATPQSDPRRVARVYRGHVASFGKGDNGLQVAQFVDATGRYPAPVNLMFHLPYYTREPPPLEIGKPMITFCYQKDDVCTIGDESVGIIADSNVTFQEIQKLIGADR